MQEHMPHTPTGMHARWFPRAKEAVDCVMKKRNAWMNCRNRRLQFSSNSTTIRTRTKVFTLLLLVLLLLQPMQSLHQQTQIKLLTTAITPMVFQVLLLQTHWRWTSTPVQELEFKRRPYPHRNPLLKMHRHRFTRTNHPLSRFWPRHRFLQAKTFTAPLPHHRVCCHRKNGNRESNEKCWFENKNRLMKKTS